MKKKMNSTKLVSIVLIASLCASLISACNGDGQVDDRTTQPSFRETVDPAKIGLDEPNQSIETMDTSIIETETEIETIVEIPTEATTEEPNEITTEATSEPSWLPVTVIEGDYVYTLYEGTEYEMTIRMDIPIDSYMLSPEEYNNGLNYWEIQRIANDRNWLEDGQYTLADIYDDWAEDIGTHTIGGSPIYMLNCDGYRVYIEIEHYDDSLPDFEWRHQISAIRIRYIETDSLDPAFIEPSPEQMDVSIFFGQHPDNCDYHCDRKCFGGSFEDIVILQYVFIQCRWHEGDSSIFYGYFPNAQIVDGEWVINLP